MTEPLLADARARERATDPARSAIVQAPAGSGKTTLLVERYLNLLAVVSQPEEILAITFTRKAAAEMRARIIEALSDESNPRSRAILARSATLGWALPRASNRLKVQTIDSFAAAVARRLPTTSALPPNAQFTERAGQFYHQAAQNLFARIDAGDVFAEELLEVLAAFDGQFDRAAALIASMLARRDQWLDPVQLVMQGTASGAAAALAQSIERGLKRLGRSIVDEIEHLLDDSFLRELDELAAYAAANLSQPWSAERPYPASQWRLIGVITTKNTGELRAQVNRNQGFPAGGDSAREMKQRMLALLQALRLHDADERFANLKRLPDVTVSDGELARLRLFSLSLVLATLELQALFRATNLVDFTELTFASYRALGEDDAPTDLALALDAKLNHLLVDEFQDTSIAQFRLLERLIREWSPGDGRTFFAVGDPMQSIYRFRDADVSLYLKTVAEGIGQLRPEALELSSNFRSAAGLVNWVNEVFEPAFHGAPDPILGRVRFAVATPTKHHDATIAVCLTDIERPDEETARVTDIVQKLRTEHPGQSIAVLVRNRSHLGGLLARLDSLDVAWEGHEIEPLAGEPVVMDLLELMRTFADPANRVARLAVLRAPFVGLNLEDLATLCESTNLDGPWTQVDASNLTDDGRSRLNRVLPALVQAERHYAQQPLRRWLENLWLVLGGPDAYPDARALTSAARLFDHLEETDPNGCDLHAFAESLGDLYTASVSTEDAVQVMTIHKAKGLEFDHVIVPGLDRSSPADDPPMLLWRAEGNDVLMATSGEGQPHSLYQWLRFEERERDANERTRLLYVAATRARRSLHLLARANAENPRFSRQSLLGRTWGQLAAQAQFTGPPPQPEQQLLIDTVSRQQLPAAYRWQMPEAPRNLYVEHAFERSEPAAAATSLVADVAIGTVVHAALKRFADEGIPETDRLEEAIAGRRAHWRAQLLDEGLNHDALDTAVDQVAANIRATLTDTEGRWLLSVHDEAVSEAAFTGVFDGKLTNIVVDRTFVEDGRRWIVDFKSSTPRGDLESFIAEQHANHAAQLRRYRDMLKAFDARPVVAGLYFTRPGMLSLLD